MLNRFSLIIGLVLGIIFQLTAQITKEFRVEEKHGYNLVYLNFNVYKGVTQINRKLGDEPVFIHSHLSKVNILPSFNHEIRDEILYANLVHRNVESENLGKSLSYKLFSSSNDDFDHKWSVGLNSNFLYDLHFYFGIGTADIDLAYLPVSNCIINSTSADVKLNYSKNSANSVKMDTIMVTINMGNLEASNLNFTNAKEMIFEANYGTLNLSFSDKMPEACNIQAMVGAGKVNLILPDDSQPYIVKIKSTPMCRTYIPKHLKDIGNKTYVSRTYKENSANLMTFDIDVSVGSVTLK
jgi:hypothetical protein